MAEEEQQQQELEAAEAKAEEEEARAAEAEEVTAEEDEPYSPDSSMVASWGYDREQEQLEVEFVNGHTESFSCSPQQWQSAKEAASPGKWMHQEML